MGGGHDLPVGLDPGGRARLSLLPDWRALISRFCRAQWAPHAGTCGWPICARGRQGIGNSHVLLSCLPAWA